jgi:hypothetical protein
MKAQGIKRIIIFSGAKKMLVTSHMLLCPIHLLSPLYSFHTSFHQLLKFNNFASHFLFAFVVIFYSKQARITCTAACELAAKLQIIIDHIIFIKLKCKETMKNLGLLRLQRQCHAPVTGLFFSFPNCVCICISLSLCFIRVSPELCGEIVLSVEPVSL